MAVSTNKGLLVWLPLTDENHCENLGLVGKLTCTTTPTFVDGGKLGKCMSTGAYLMSATLTSKTLNNNLITIAFWIYVNTATGTTSGRTAIFGNGGMDANNNRKFWVTLYPNVNSLHLSWLNDAANVTYIGVVYNNILPSYKWTHVTITYSNPTCKVYINGELIATETGVSNSSTFAYTTQLMSNNTARCINDYRVYSYALSPQEIKDLSRGIVGHWLGNDGWVIPNLYTSTALVQGESFSGSFTKTIKGGYTNYKLNRTGNGNNSWPNMYTSACSFVAGKTYVWHCKIRVNSCSAGFRADGFVLRNAVCTNDYTHGGVNIDLSEASFGKWKVYETSYTVPATQSQGNTASQPQLQFYCGGQASNGTVYSVDFDITDCGIYQSDVKLGASWVANTGTPGHPAFLSDTSGNHLNLTPVGTVTLNGTTPRYDKCLDLTANTSSYLTIPAFNIHNNCLTMSWWAKRTAASSGLENLLNIGSRLLVWYRDGLWSPRVRCYKSSDPSNTYFGESSFASSSTADTNWHHYCFVIDGKTMRLYYDGTLASTLTTTYDCTSSLDSTGQLGVAKVFLSDIRLYATPIDKKPDGTIDDTPVKELKALGH